MEKIEIALASDNGYYCGLVATAGSIAMYASKEVALSFNILDGGISDKNYYDFIELVKYQHPNVEFIRHKIDETLFNDFPTWKDNYMAYARLLLDKLMPNSDFVIYCDVDFLWLADIYELWKQRDDNIIFIGVNDTCIETLEKEKKWFEERKYPFDEKNYICSGLTFFNLNLIRKEKIFEKIYKWLKENPDVQFPDQAAINYILYGRMKIVDTMWQQLTISLDVKSLKNSIVLHYAGEIPWKRRDWREMLTDTILLWHRVNAILHQKTTLWSLKKYYSVYELVKYRFLFCALQNKLFKSLFFWLLNNTGRHGYVKNFQKWLHPFNYKKIIDKQIKK